MDINANNKKIQLLDKSQYVSIKQSESQLPL